MTDFRFICVRFILFILDLKILSVTERHIIKTATDKAFQFLHRLPKLASYAGVIIVHYRRIDMLQSSFFKNIYSPALYLRHGMSESLSSRSRVLF